MSLFGRQLRDFIPWRPEDLIGTMWREIADAREKALLPRGQGAHEQWSAHARKLPPLMVGDDVMIQNQRGNYPRRWDKRGVVVEVLTQVSRGHVVGEGHDEDPVPDQVEQGPVGGEGRVEDPVRDQVVQGPMGGDVPDAELLQPDEVAMEHPADPGPTIRRSARVSRVPNKYKDFVMGD